MRRERCSLPLDHALLRAVFVRRRVDHGKRFLIGLSVVAFGVTGAGAYAMRPQSAAERFEASDDGDHAAIDAARRAAFELTSAAGREACLDEGLARHARCYFWQRQCVLASAVYLQQCVAEVTPVESPCTTWFVDESTLAATAAAKARQHGLDEERAAQLLAGTAGACVMAALAAAVADGGEAQLVEQLRDAGAFGNEVPHLAEALDGGDEGRDLEDAGALPRAAARYAESRVELVEVEGLARSEEWILEGLMSRFRKCTLDEPAGARFRLRARVGADGEVQAVEGPSDAAARCAARVLKNAAFELRPAARTIAFDVAKSAVSP